MISRRDFLRLSALASAAALINWECPVLAKGGKAHKGGYDVIIIGAGLGGLSCAAFLASSGIKPLVIERHEKPGGYATSFERGGFTCEVSLHGTTAGDPQMKKLLEELGVWDEVTFVPHNYSWSTVFPDFTLDLPICDLDTIEQILVETLGEDPEGLSDYMTTWKKVLIEMEHLTQHGMPEDPSQFPVLYPTLWVLMGMTLADLHDWYGFKDPKLRAALGQSWPYFGVPPSQLPSWFYLWVAGSYHLNGNWYLKGTSQSLTDALNKVITDRGGKVILKSEVTEIILDNGRAVGVKAKGDEYYGNAVVSNIAAQQTFGELLPPSVVPDDYRYKIFSSQVSHSNFNVWLGLDRDITNLISRSNAMVYMDYDEKETYDGMMECNPRKSGFGMLVYDKIIDDFSPKDYSSIILTSLSGYEPWERFEADYFAGKKKEYREEKDRITEILIGLAEEYFFSDFPDFREWIIMQDASTPLTNVRYTLNTRGAFLGYDWTMDNTGFVRLGNRTPIEGLYLSSAWSYPGGGYLGVLLGGKEAFRCMYEDGVFFG